MLVWVLRRGLDARLAPVELHGSPDVQHPLFVELARRYPIVTRNQTPGDLGDRMAQAASLALRECERVILIGTDCPVLDGDYIGRMFARLSDQCPVVIGPAEDGGYVALGLSRSAPVLFDGIEWGTNRVLVQTRRQLAVLGWNYQLMPSLWDVDLPQDLMRLSRTFPELLSARSELDLDRNQALASE
jgi:rSAM/selenodomain-associated transferase 1